MTGIEARLGAKIIFAKNLHDLSGVPSKIFIDGSGSYCMYEGTQKTVI
jgi:hypothetical protein